MTDNICKNCLIDYKKQYNMANYKSSKEKLRAFDYK